MTGNIDMSKNRIIELPKIIDNRGNLTFIEGGRHIPFDIKRVYYIHNVPEGQLLDGHSNKKYEELIIALAGSFDVILNDGYNKKKVHLNRAYYGLYVSAGVWRELNNFSSNPVCLVLTSGFYSESDYIRDYAAFLDYISVDK
ncbi:MAG: FdtA/QdtA family cupin domain-containing protein [Candidatus Omnitrophota bacterium]